MINKRIEESVRIHLNATQKSALEWNKSIHEAVLTVEKGKEILWELDFGLFSRLLHPLKHPQQFLSLCLAIEHFHEIIWNRFRDSTCGVVIYQGSFSSQEILEKTDKIAFDDWIQTHLHSDKATPFSQLLFCRDVALDYIKQLAGQFPYGVDIFIQLSLDDSFTPIEKLIFLNEECYKPLLYQVNGNFIAVEDSEAKVGICLPPMNRFFHQWNFLLDEALKKLSTMQIRYRPIPEESLITHLEGLDDLIICPSAISLPGKRQLQGFCAAGGRILSLETTLLGLTNELKFENTY